MGLKHQQTRKGGDKGLSFLSSTKFLPPSPLTKFFFILKKLSAHGKLVLLYLRGLSSPCTRDFLGIFLRAAQNSVI